MVFEYMLCAWECVCKQQAYIVFVLLLLISPSQVGPYYTRNRVYAYAYYTQTAPANPHPPTQTLYSRSNQYATKAKLEARSQGISQLTLNAHTSTHADLVAL